MSNHVKKRDYRRRGSRHFSVSRVRKSRPKTFRTEESAKKWAEENKIAKYTLENLKSESASTKKIRVIY